MCPPSIGPIKTSGAQCATRDPNHVRFRLCSGRDASFLSMRSSHSKDASCTLCIFIFGYSLIGNLPSYLLHACSRDIPILSALGGEGREIAGSYVTGKRLCSFNDNGTSTGGQDFYNCRGGYFFFRGGRPVSYASPPQILVASWLKASIFLFFYYAKEIWLHLLLQRLSLPWKHPTPTPHYHQKRRSTLLSYMDPATFDW
jgi:hypothetical protein